MTPAHPFAPFGYRAGVISLAVGVAALGLWWIWPNAFSADLAGLLLAYALTVGLLEPVRRWDGNGLMVTWTIGAIAAGAWFGNWQASWLHTRVANTGTWHGAIGGYVAAMLCVLILPGLIRRWLAWREARLLLEQAAKHAAERTLLEARLAALQGQIEPHFLFNTLANVQYLLRRDAAKADEMLSHLNDYLRATLPELRQTTASLGQELARVRAYLDIMQIRMGERLTYHIDSSPKLLLAQLPPLALATLVENALKHGLEPKSGGGCIQISASQSDSQLQVVVRDNGVGFSETGNTGGGIGLRNLRERLQTQFGDAAGLLLEANPEGGVSAALHLPLHWQGEHVE